MAGEILRLIVQQRHYLDVMEVPEQFRPFAAAGKVYILSNDMENWGFDAVLGSLARRRRRIPGGREPGRDLLTHLTALEKFLWAMALERGWSLHEGGFTVVRDDFHWPRISQLTGLAHIEQLSSPPSASAVTSSRWDPEWTRHRPALSRSRSLPIYPSTSRGKRLSFKKHHHNNNNNFHNRRIHHHHHSPYRQNALNCSKCIATIHPYAKRCLLFRKNLGQTYFVLIIMVPGDSGW